MSEPFLLEIPERFVEQAQTIAKHTGRSVKEVLAEWLLDHADEPPVEMLSDEQILTLSYAYLPDQQQNELSDLLAANQAGVLSNSDKARLDELMKVYRRGLVRKAQAMQVAVERGLRPSLNEEAE